MSWIYSGVSSSPSSRSQEFLGHPRRLEIELVEVAPFVKGREADETVPDCGVVESCAGIRSEKRQQDIDMLEPVLLATYQEHPVNRLKGALDLLHRVHAAADD